MSPSAEPARARTGATALVETLEAAGVRYVFGVPGTTVMDIIDAIGASDTVEFIACRHEQVASFMADGVGRATHSPGVCLASRGPGAANLAIGLHNAHAESIPMVAVVGQVSDALVHRGAFEEMELTDVFSTMTKSAIEIHEADRIGELVGRTLSLATSGRPGPTLVSIPHDRVQALVDAAPRPLAPPPFRPAPAPDALVQAAQLLCSASRPLIVLGGGSMAMEHDPNVIALAEALDAPVVTTWLRKDAFPNRHANFLGTLGYGAADVSEQAAREADVILALGCRFSEFTTRRWTLLDPATKIIHVDIDPDELGHSYPAALPIVSDARIFTAAVLPLVEADAASGPVSERQRSCRELTTEFRASTEMPAAASDAPGVPTAAVISALQTVLDDAGARVALVQDAATLGPWIGRYLEFDRHASSYGAGGGSMGWGFGAALGIQLARPDTRVICVTGDGSFWMVGQDLETAVRHSIPLITVVVNNFSYGNTRDRQRVDFNERYLGVFHTNPDFAAYARLLGAHGERVEDASELPGALKRAMEATGPSVIDVIQDRHEGLPPGMRPPASRTSTTSRES